MPTLPAISPGAKRLGLAFAVAFAVATAAFWAIMLFAPPLTAAGMIGPGFQAAESTAVAGAFKERCSVGTEVSNFVCRNTWMDHHPYSYR